ncbi:MAG: hypothetical protein E7A62_05545 [Actinomycetaceae bacterium]|nr:hypothetical protein [Actinomycetaceae bacterium]MDU0970448.1 hypothetical protein [Actinomycetaceae bacterium]
MTRPKPHTVEAARRNLLAWQAGVSVVVIVAAAVVAGIQLGTVSVLVALPLLVLAVGLIGVTAVVTRIQIADMGKAMAAEFAGLFAKALVIVAALAIAVALAIPRTLVGIAVIVMVIAHAIAGAVGAHRARVLIVDDPQNGGT